MNERGAALLLALLMSSALALAVAAELEQLRVQTKRQIEWREAAALREQAMDLMRVRVRDFAAVSNPSEECRTPTCFFFGERTPDGCRLSAPVADLRPTLARADGVEIGVVTEFRCFLAEAPLYMSTVEARSASRHLRLRALHSARGVHTLDFSLPR